MWSLFTHDQLQRKEKDHEEENSLRTLTKNQLTQSWCRKYGEHAGKNPFFHFIRYAQPTKNNMSYPMIIRNIPADESGVCPAIALSEGSVAPQCSPVMSGDPRCAPHCLFSQLMMPVAPEFGMPSLHLHSTELNIRTFKKFFKRVSPEDVPSVLTVLNTVEAERNTEQQGQSRLVCCYLKFHALAIIRQHPYKGITLSGV